MKSVWIVERGCYSDYSVLGIFSTEELAIAYADAVNGPMSPEDDDCSFASVSERVLDPTLDPTGGRLCISASLAEWLGRPTRLPYKELERGEWYYDWTAGVRPEVTNAWWHSDEIRITAWGMDKEYTLRSGRELARAIEAGTVVVPPNGRYPGR